MRKVVISGIGLITPLGKNWNDFVQKILIGQGAIKNTTLLLEGKKDLNVPLAKIDDFDPQYDLPNCKVGVWDRATLLSIFSARQAMLAAGLHGKEIDGLIVGISTTSIEVLDDSYRRTLLGNGRIPPLNIPKSMPNAPASAVCIDLGIKAFSYSVASACSSANQAIINAALLIKTGQAKKVLCGSADSALTYSNVNAWAGMHVLAKDTCRPFCKTRSGLALGEGSVFFVLEEKDSAITRGANILAELDGWGQSSDAYSITTPHVEGIAAAIRAAIKDANMSINEIDYFNAHGTGTVLNDTTESKAIIEVFGDKGKLLPVSSTKSLHGHLLGASGGIELAATIAAIRHNTVPPTINLIEQDEEVQLNIIANYPSERNISRALSASYAFGGHNTVLAVSAPS